MTKLLEHAIEKIRELADEEQDALATALISVVPAGLPVIDLDDETRAAIDEGLAEAQRGEFVPEAEMQAFWTRHGL